MDKKIIILGAGASGLMAAIICARQNNKVVVIEKNNKAGRKILATGNGKCNYTNRVQNEKYYRSSNKGFPNKVFSEFDVNRTIHFFESLGIHPKEVNGYLYPSSEQSQSVVQVLEMECKRLGVEIYYEHNIKEIRKPFFTLVSDHKTFHGHKLILAAGGCASPNLGSDGSGYNIAKNFGHSIIKPLPALVQLVSLQKYCKMISGVRVPAKVTVNSNGKILEREEGEILFTQYGISGIPILQISRYVSQALDEGQRVNLSIDFMPKINKEESYKLLINRKNRAKGKTCEEYLIGLFNNKLSLVLLKESKIDKDKKVSSLSNQDIDKLNTNIKEFNMTINDTKGFENAQVTAGGVNTKEVNPITMESNIIKDLYFAGEIVDVDGTCGGYNLQWAWSSGYVAGLNAGSK